MSSDYVVIGYYTENSPYEAEAAHLKESLVKFGVNHDLRAVRNFGSWDANTHYKPKFIREMLDKWAPHPVIFFDIDSIVCQDPVLFKECDTDIGVCYFDWSHRGVTTMQKYELSGAVLYFKNNDNCRWLVEKWIQGCWLLPKVWDQKILEAILEEPATKARISVTKFPLTYDVIFDLMKHIKDPVIKQMQASRRTRTEMEANYEAQMKKESHERLLFNRYTGRPVLILGKGESVKELIGVKIPEKFIVIGINDIFKQFKKLDLLFYFDAITYGENKVGIDALQAAGTPIWTLMGNSPPKAGHFKLRMEGEPYGFHPGKFFHSYTSAYFALQMAIWAGSKQIFLAGVDLKIPASGDYFDGSKAREGKGFPNHLNLMRKGFELAAAQRSSYDFDVYRTSSISTLHCFPVRSIQDCA